MDFKLISNPLALTKIKIMGVGGAGGNAVNTLIHTQTFGVEFLVANTDLQDLGKSAAKTKLQLGKKLTEGLGAGGDPEKGKKAAEESILEIEEALQDTNLLLITAGMGGGTGTGAAPVIAQKARDMGILTLAVVTLPFKFEGQMKLENASLGIRNLQNCVDTIIVVPNSKITEVYRNLLMKDALKKSDEIVTNAVQSIADIINKPGDLNVDFADVKVAMKNMGYAMIGIGSATGKDRAINAANDAISNPLLSDINLSGCKAVLLNVTVGHDFMMEEFETINEIITGKTGTSGLIKPGLITDDSFEDKIRVTIIATGLPPSDIVKALPASIGQVFVDRSPNPAATIPFTQTTLVSPIVASEAENVETARVVTATATESKVISIANAGSGSQDYSPLNYGRITSFDGATAEAPDFLRKYQKQANIN